MKHNLKVTAILLAMFFIAQLIGIFVVNSYTGESLPYGMQPPEMKPQESVISIMFSLFIAVMLIFLLMKIKATLFIKLWFFAVVVIALALFFNSIFLYFPQISSYSSILAIILAIPLAIYKIFKRNIIVHNITELLVYPGIAAVFVPILNMYSIIILLLLISAYDIYAVWHSGFMQKMAKFQINQLKIFTGFFLPYADKKTRMQINLLKEKYKNNIPNKVLKKKRFKIQLAILGGGDVVFPIILAGVVLRTLGLYQALTISIFATLSLLYLFIAAKKGKFYPAMPYLTAGCLLGLVVVWLVSLL